MAQLGSVHPGDDGNGNLTSGGVDQFFSRTDSTGTFTPLTDALGSTVALTDSTGAVQTQYTYEPFGNTSGPASNNTFEYTGRENDGTGVYFYRARYYSPVYQRFISEDPIGFAGGVNLYAYVDGDPLNWVDPLGSDVTVTRFEGEGHNGFGHVGICVSGHPSVGFTDLNPSDDTKATLGRTVPGFPKPIDPNRVVQDQLTIPTTPQQDAAIQKAIDDRTSTPGNYNSRNRNCAQFAADALAAGNIRVPPITLPKSLMDELHAIYPNGSNRSVCSPATGTP